MAKIHIANAYDKNSYVFVSKTMSWSVIDIIGDIGSFAIGIGEIKALINVGKLPKTVSTAKEFHQFMKILYKLLKGMGGTAGKSVEAVQEAVEQLIKQSIKISPNEFKDIKDTSWFDWTDPSSIIGEVLGADTINLTVATDNGAKIVNFSANQDESWIITSSGVVRSKYGTIWVQAPEEGKHEWETIVDSETEEIQQSPRYSYKLKNNTGKDLYFMHLAGRIGYTDIPPKEGVTSESIGLLLPKDTASGWGKASCYLDYESSKDYFQIYMGIYFDRYDKERDQIIVFDIPNEYRYDSEIEIVVNKNIHKSVAIINGDIRINRK